MMAEFFCVFRQKLEGIALNFKPFRQTINVFLYLLCLSVVERKRIKELTKFADQDLRSLLKDLRSLIRNDSYDTYTGLFSETEGSVSFLFETEEIKAK